jgi:hypothetical protein
MRTAELFLASFGALCLVSFSLAGAWVAACTVVRRRR